MGKVKNPHSSAGGHAADLRQVINRIGLPEEISCCICRELYPPAFYSKGQLHELRKAIHTHGRSILAHQKVAKCFSCSSGHSVERKCRICKNWKAIDLFSRNQRNLDMPICRSCQDYFQQEEYADDRRHIMGEDDMPRLAQATVPSGIMFPNTRGVEIVDELSNIPRPKKPDPFVRVRPSRLRENRSHIASLGDFALENTGGSERREPVMEAWEYL